MILERTDDEIIMRIPSFVNFEEVQRIIDLMMYKEATARSKATQEDIDMIARDAKKGWWKANRERFIKSLSHAGKFPNLIDSFG